MASRLVHDTAWAIASALTEKLDYKLVPAERGAFHRLAYETCKAAILRHDAQRDRERRIGYRSVAARREHQARSVCRMRSRLVTLTRAGRSGGSQSIWAIV